MAERRSVALGRGAARSENGQRLLAEERRAGVGSGNQRGRSAPAPVRTGSDSFDNRARARWSDFGLVRRVVRTAVDNVR